MSFRIFGGSSNPASWARFEKCSAGFTPMLPFGPRDSLEPAGVKGQAKIRENLIRAVLHHHRLASRRLAPFPGAAFGGEAVVGDDVAALAPTGDGVLPFF